MTFTPLINLIQNHASYDASEAASIESLKQFLTESNNPYDRSNLVAHVVCDAWVVSPDYKQVLLLVHGESGEWLAPGGHADGNPDILAGSQRELFEETGIATRDSKILMQGGVFDINVGAVPERQKSYGIEPSHIHFDVCFAFEANPETVKLQISDESLDLAWKPIDKALEMMMPCHRRRAEKTLNGYLK